MKKKVGLVLLTFLLIGLVSPVHAVQIGAFSTLTSGGESGFRLVTDYWSDEASTLCTKIVLDTSSIGGVIKEPFMPISPPSGCTISGWDTQQLMILCSPGLPAGYEDLTDVLMEDAGGIPMVDFSGAKITVTYTGSDCIFSGIFVEQPESDPSIFDTLYGGSCGGAINSPEFPSAFLPVTLIIGFLGAVLLIQRTREH